MKNDAQKNILFLVLAGLVFIAVNLAVFMGAKGGQLAPIENLVLWGSFAVLNICSLLWAVSLLGLQPLVLAFSYVTGGFLAFQGVRLLPDVNVAEVTTAGATFGAFGLLVAGNATTRVRLAFFHKAQVPFVFVMVALLAMDGLLNSRVSAAGWNVILNALVLPFIFSGIVVGFAWAMVSRFVVGQGVSRPSIEALSDLPAEQAAAAEAMAELVIHMPEDSEVAAEPEETASILEVVEPAPEPEKPVVLEMVETPMEPEPLEQEEPVEESSDFFPLEIDKGEDCAPPQEAPSLVVVESPPAVDRISEMDIFNPAEDSASDFSDWLNDQAEMLDNLKKKAS